MVVAPDRVKGVCSGAGAPVPLAEIVGDLVGSSSSNGAAVIARGGASLGPGPASRAHRQGDAAGEGDHFRGVRKLVRRRSGPSQRSDFGLIGDGDIRRN